MELNTQVLGFIQRRLLVEHTCTDNQGSSNMLHTQSRVGESSDERDERDESDESNEN